MRVRSSVIAMLAVIFLAAVMPAPVAAETEEEFTSFLFKGRHGITLNGGSRHGGEKRRLE